MDKFDLNANETIESLLTKIRSAQDSFNPKEQEAAIFFAQNPYVLLTEPMTQIAKSSNVSQAGWVRFSQKIGFAGIKELKQFLGQELVDQNSAQDETTPYADIKGEGEIENLVSRVFDRNINAITETREIMNLDAIKEAVNIITSSNIVALFGIWASGLVALDAQYKFNRIGLNAVSVMDLHMQITLAATLSENDVAIIISNSGNTKDTIDITEAAKSSGAKIIAITKFGPSKIKEYADLVLYNSTEEVVQRSSATASRISQLTIIDILLTILGNQNQGQVSEMLDRSHDYLMKHDLKD